MAVSGSRLAAISNQNEEIIISFFNDLNCCPIKVFIVWRMFKLQDTHFFKLGSDVICKHSYSLQIWYDSLKQKCLKLFSELNIPNIIDGLFYIPSKLFLNNGCKQPVSHDHTSFIGKLCAFINFFLG